MVICQILAQTIQCFFVASESESKHSLRRDILLLLLLAFVLRAGPLVLVPRVIDSPDAVYYLTEAEKYTGLALSELDPKIPPLYPILAAVLHVLIPDLEWAARIVSLIFSTLTIVPVYLLAREMHGRASARVAAVLVSIWPWLMDYGGRVTTEALAVFLWFLAVWLFAKGMRSHVGWIVAAALVFFGLHLTRPEGTFVLLAAIPAAFILKYRDGRVEVKRLIPFIAVAALTLTVYALWMRQLAGEATLNYRLGFVLDKPEGSTVLTDFIKTFSGMIGEVPAIMLGPFLWMFAGVGLIGTVSEEKGQSTRSKTRLGQSLTKEKRDFRLETYVLFFALVQWVIVLANLSPAPRYIMAFFIVALFWSARGIVGVGELARNLPAGKLLRHAPLGFIVAIMAFHYGVTTAGPHPPDAPRVQDCGTVDERQSRTGPYHDPQAAGGILRGNAEFRSVLGGHHRRYSEDGPGRRFRVFGRR